MSSLRLSILLLALLPLTSRYAAAQDLNLHDLSFMSGCWKGTFQSRAGPGTMEEFYTTPSDNVMLGTTRYIREGQTVMYEFTFIGTDSLGIYLRPYPRGSQSPDDFRLTELDAGRAVFESPEHDYPKRIIYSSEEDGSRVARIDGGADDAEGTEWRLWPVECG